MAPVVATLRERHMPISSSSADKSTPWIRPDQGVLPVHTGNIREELHPILDTLPLQRLAHALSLERGENPDAPPGLRKVTETW